MIELDTIELAQLSIANDIANRIAKQRELSRKSLDISTAISQILAQKD